MIGRRNLIAKIAGMIGLGSTAVLAKEAPGIPTLSPHDPQPMMALGYLSRLLPGDYVLAQEPMKMAEDITSHVNGQIDKLGIQLKCCGQAATLSSKEGIMGTGYDAKPGDLGYSSYYADTLILRNKFEAALEHIAKFTPPSFVAAFYECGCSASGYSPDGSDPSDPKKSPDKEFPMYCPEHGSSDNTGRSNLVRGDYRGHGKYYGINGEMA